MTEYALRDEPLGDFVSEETIVLSYEELEEAVVQYLRRNSELDENEYIISTDLPVDLDEDGNFEFDVTIGVRNGS